MENLKFAVIVSKTDQTLLFFYKFIDTSTKIRTIFSFSCYPNLHQIFGSTSNITSVKLRKTSIFQTHFVLTAKLQIHLLNSWLFWSFQAICITYLISSKIYSMISNYFF